MKLTPEFESDIRQRVNPLYANQRGTESYERAALLGEIDRLRMRVTKLEAAFDGVMQEVEARGKRIDALSFDFMRLHSAIKHTLDENGHLADGDVCTLRLLKLAIGEE